MLEEAVMGIGGASGAAGVQIRGEVDERGRSLVPAVKEQRREFGVFSYYKRDGLHAPGNDVQMLLGGTNQGRGHGMRDGDGMVRFHADLRHQAETSDDAKEPY
jgi:hypothetical protein